MRPPGKISKLFMFIIFIVVAAITYGILTGDKSKTPSSATREASTAVSTGQSTLSPGTSYYTKSFAIWVRPNAKVEFTKTIGSGYSKTSVEDEGTLFALVPVCIKNRSTATESLIGVSWYLHAASGEKFKPATLADFYLDEQDKINPYDIPPGITRCGKLVFLVTEGARAFLVTEGARDSSFLKLEADGWSFTALFKAPM